MGDQQLASFQNRTQSDGNTMDEDIATSLSEVVGRDVRIARICDIISAKRNLVKFLSTDSKWEDLADVLEMCPATIEKQRRNLAINLCTLSAVLHNVLLEWFGSKGNAATVGRLLDAFRDIKAEAIISELITELNIQTNQ